MEINPQNNMDNQNFSVPPSEQGSQMPQNPTPKNKLPLYLGGIVILVVLAAGGYFVLFQNKLPNIAEDIIKPASVFASSFATYTETPVNINPKIGLYFKTVLRALLRQDPDILMVSSRNLVLFEEDFSSLLLQGRRDSVFLIRIF